MPWKLDADRPIFLQLVELLQMDILSGKYKPGDKLSAVRDLAQEAAVNPNTMQKALAELERLGLVYTERTSGRFVTTDQNLIMNLKKEQASVVIKDFLDKMKKIGYDDASILEFIKETLERSKE